jgi:DNA-binding LytR/AlgR family response regulator
LIFFLVYKKPYLSLFLLSGKELYLDFSVSAMASRLPQSFFVCNQSEIINLWHVQSICKKGSGMTAVMKDGTRFLISRRNQGKIREEFLSVKTDYFGCCHNMDFMHACKHRMVLSKAKVGNILFGHKEMILRERNKILCISYADIVSLIAKKPFTLIRTIGGECIQINPSLSRVVRHLPPVFLLCNRSEMINLLHVNLLRKEKTFCLLYTAFGNSFRVLRCNIPELERKLSGIKIGETNYDCLSCKLFSGIRSNGSCL